MMENQNRIIKILIPISKMVLVVFVFLISFLGTFYSYKALLLQSQKSDLFLMFSTVTFVIIIIGLLVALYGMNKKRRQAEVRLREENRRKISEEEFAGIKASKESYQSMIQYSNEPIWTLDRNGRFLSANKSFEEMAGFKANELIGREFTTIVLKESVPLYRKALGDALKGKAGTLTLRILHKYLKPLILSINVSPIVSCGDIIGTVSFGRDITMKRSFEVELLRRNRELSALHQMASATDYSLDFKSSTKQFLKIIVEAMKGDGGAIFLFGERDQKFLQPLCAVGVSHEQEFIKAIKGFKMGEGLVGTIALLEEPMSIEDINEDIEASGPAILKEHFRGFAGAPIKYQKDVFGVIVVYYRSPHSLEEDDLKFFMTLSNELALDLSNALLAEETHKKSERMETITKTNEELYEKIMEENIKWENIFDSIPYPICIHDRKNVIVKTNNAFSEKLGLTPKDLVGKKCHEILRQDDSSIPVCSLSEGENHPDHFLEVKLFDGLYELGTFPLLNLHGESNGVIHLLIDRAKMKRLREEQIQQEKLSAISQLVAGLAHELNHPLLNMMGYLQLLLSKEDNEDHQTYEERILRETERASQILKNLLAFSRKKKVEKKVADMNAIIEKVLEQRSPQILMRNIKFIKNLKPDLPKVFVDEKQMELVLLNILLNAEQAMISQGMWGNITIHSSCLTSQNKDIVRIEIFDEGPGIPEEILLKIFDPFFTTKSSEKKTGLGLSICSGIINAHGGTIRARNYERGAVFTIDLPSLEEEAVEKKEKEASLSL